MAQSDAFYQEIAEEVDAVLVELGTSYSVRGPAVYDETTLTRGKGTSRTVVGLVADQEVAINMLGSGTDMRGDAMSAWTATKSLILQASSNPLPEEEVLVDGQWYPLSMAKPIKPAEITVVYMLDISR